ncbi:hypothetical protein HMPREF9446_00618 [Bacteroides fluxus YIT 12057]|uniref:Uncharacterized protein n=1 Tax=Bacteroides fluxus YIT 12057 TaxID=763034 RepID=F3PPH7_9BACE|nr:hypothetical protein HMPREF9446_00618 [Bacteroides fluxus YIT 12057]
MPCLWQTFAKAMAKFCQGDGNVLPIRWQSIANVVARSCLFVGKKI